MVKKKIVLLGAFIVLIAAVAGFMLLRSTEEQKIKRMLNEFCQNAAKKQESSSAAALLVKTNVLQRYFADPCQLTLHRGFINGSYSDVRAANEIIRANMFLQSSDFAISDLQIKVDNLEAAAVFTGRFRGILKSG